MNNQNPAEASPQAEDKLLAEIENLRASAAKARLDADIAEEKRAVEIENVRASAAKTRIDTAIAEDSRGKVSFLRSIPASQYTIFLALLTLLVQIVQSGCNSAAQRKADEDKQWREAIKTVSFTDGEKAAQGGLVFQGFYESDRYGDDSRAMVASILPVLSNASTFDKIFNNLRRASDFGQAGYLYDVAKSVTTLYSDDYVDSGFSRQQSPTFFKQQLSGEKQAATNDLLHEWKLREWEVDTITRGLIDFWKQVGTRPSSVSKAGSKRYSADLRGIVLRLDDDAPVYLNGLDFSNARLTGSYLSHIMFIETKLTKANLHHADMSDVDLSKANLDCAILDQTDLSNVTSFESSSWKHTFWSHASLSAPLRAYLQRQFPEETEKAASDACGAPPD
jgi:hypothetical protein